MDEIQVVNCTASESSKVVEPVAPLQDSDAKKPRAVQPCDMPKPLSGWRLGAVMFTLFFGLFLATVETSITATALVSIGDYFNDSFTATWVVLSYLLSYMGFSVIFARFSDAIGRQMALLVAWILFSAFSLASGLSSTLAQLIIFRALQGIGGSGLYSMTMVVLPEVAPPRQWGLVSGLMGVVFACSSIVGPVIGGVITQRSTWRWIYLFNAPAAVVAVVLLLVAWPKSSERKLPANSLSLIQMDVPGALLLLAASTLLVFALQQAGNRVYAWNSPPIIGSLVVSAACWCMFVVWIVWLESGQTKVRLKPIFPPSVVRQIPTGPAILMAMFTGFPFFTVIINLPMRFQIVNGDGPILAGVHLLPLLAASAVGATIGGSVNTKKNLTSYSLIVAACLMLIGTGLLSITPTGREIAAVQYVYQCILGLGFGITLSSLTIMVTFANDRKTLASAQGAVNQARVLGGSIGLAVTTIIFNEQVGKDLCGILDPVQLHNLQQSLATILGLTPGQQAAVAEVFAKSFNQQMRVCMYLSAVSVVVALFTWQKVAPVIGYREKSARSAENSA